MSQRKRTRDDYADSEDNVSTDVASQSSGGYKRPTIQRSVLDFQTLAEALEACGLGGNTSQSSSILSTPIRRRDDDTVMKDDSPDPFSPTSSRVNPFRDVPDVEISSEEDGKESSDAATVKNETQNSGETKMRLPQRYKRKANANRSDSSLSDPGENEGKDKTNEISDEDTHNEGQSGQSDVSDEENDVAGILRYNEEGQLTTPSAMLVLSRLLDDENSEDRLACLREPLRRIVLCCQTGRDVIGNLVAEHGSNTAEKTTTIMGKPRRKRSRKKSSKRTKTTEDESIVSDRYDILHGRRKNYYQEIDKRFNEIDKVLNRVAIKEFPDLYSQCTEEQREAVKALESASLCHMALQEWTESENRVTVCRCPELTIERVYRENWEDRLGNDDAYEGDCDA